VKGSDIFVANILPVSLAAMALALGGCANTPPPLAELARADASINMAEQAGARDQAPLELDSAREKLRQARDATAAEDYVTARRLAEQAQVEAELAQAKAQSAQAQQMVQQVRESIRILREEIGATSVPGGAL
jgi:predicted S18 family serine protease